MNIQLYQKDRELFAKVLAKMRRGYNFDYACQSLSLEPDYVIDGIIYNDLILDWIGAVRAMKEQQRKLNPNSYKTVSEWSFEVAERKSVALTRIKSAIAHKKDSIQAVMECFETTSTSLAECAKAHGFDIDAYRVVLFASADLTARFRAVIDRRTAETNEQLRESYTTLVPEALRVIQNRLAGNDVKRRVQQTTKTVPIKDSQGAVISSAEETTNIAEEQTILPTAADVKLAMQIAGVLPGAQLAAQNANSGEGGITDMELQKLQEAFGITTQREEEEQDGEL